MSTTEAGPGRVPPAWAPAVQGLWKRVTGGGRPLRLSSLLGSLPGPLHGTRRFRAQAKRNQLHVAASDGLAACVGIHRYLAEACGVRITWDTDLPLPRDDLPDCPPIHGHARVDEFYYLNFCTFSYSTAYWGWDEWEREIDWMALHGVTMPLNLVGHEAALALAYGRLGLTDGEIRAFLGGPGYLPWVYLGCLDGFAGPLPDNWIPAHLELGRRILRRERAFGMTPVLPAFTGHVPPRLAPPGARTRYWQGMPTTVVDPGDPLFRQLAAGIVAAQRELFGTDHYYAADPFIEMIPAETDARADYPAAVAAAVVDGLRAADPAATWVLQSWPFSYQAGYWNAQRVNGFLDRIPPDGVLILDLWGEADPQWQRLDGYAGRPWIWTGLLNFGGRSEPVADLESTDRNLEAALAADRPPVGLGLAMEAVHNNPAFFELIADRAWSAEPAGVDGWIRAFGRQRYGTADAATDQAWQALRRSVLNGHSRSIFPERFISIAVAKPGYPHLLDPDTTVHNDSRAALFYPPGELLSACRALLEIAPGAAASGALANDLVLSCAALLLRIIDHRFSALLATSVRTGRVDQRAAAGFLDAFDDLDDLVATRPGMRLETWVGSARRWADGAAGRQLLEDNARRIVTVWNTAENPRLDDYSARIWGGLVGGYYKRRWELWLRFLPRALEPGGRAAAQAELDTELARLAATVIAAGPAARETAAAPRSAAARVLDRYGDEFLTLAASCTPKGG